MSSRAARGASRKRRRALADEGAERDPYATPSSSEAAASEDDAASVAVAATPVRARTDAVARGAAGKAAGKAPASQKAASTELPRHPSSKKKLSMTGVKDGKETTLLHVPKLGAGARDFARPRSATELLLGGKAKSTTAPPTAKRSRRDAIAQLTGLRPAKGGVFVSASKAKHVAAASAGAAGAAAAAGRASGGRPPAKPKSAQLDALRPSAAAAKRQVPLPEKFATLLAKHNALDQCVSVARTLDQRTFDELKLAVERLTRRDFTRTDLGRIIAVVPNLYALTVVMIERQRQVVVSATDADGESAGSRVARSLKLKPRSEVFENELRLRVQRAIVEHIREKLESGGGAAGEFDPRDVVQVPNGFDLEEHVPDITPAPLPTVARLPNETAAALGGPSPSEPRGRSAGGGSADDIRARIRAKERRREEMLGVGAASAAVRRRSHLEHLLRDVIFFAWGQKPEGVRRKHATQPLRKAVDDLRLRNSGFDRRSAEELLRLLCDEVAGMGAAARGPTGEPWCSVLALTDDEGVTTDYFRVLREYDMGAVKAHVAAQLDKRAEPT